MSGFYFIPHTLGGHQAMPVKDSWYSERSQRPADLLDGASYPVIAECQRCHGRIRLAGKSQMEWTHDATAPASLAGDTA